MSFFEKIKAAVTSTNKRIVSAIGSKLNHLFNSTSFSEDNISELEEVLLESDVGARTTNEILELVKGYKYLSNDDQKTSLKNQIYELLIKKIDKLEIKFELTNELNLIIMAGVNGAGKTTTIKKLCNLWSTKKILVACCDTFRAAAYEQLEINIKNTQAVYFEWIGKNTPDSIAYQAIIKAKEEKFNVLFLDTSGRLQNNRNLMEEFAKFSKVANKIDQNLKPKVILVLDGSSGQNIINQIEVFSQNAHLNGLILTKFDGIAKGGIILQIAEKFDIPVYFLGTGEGANDLKEFNKEEFLKRLLDF